MSLGDELRTLRAFHGGPDHATIEQEVGLPPGTLRCLEQRYRRVGEDDEILAKLATYFGTTLPSLQFHRERYRKALSAYLEQARESKTPIRVQLRSGETMNGLVEWWDLGAFGLQDQDQLTVVQRHAVIDWEGADDR